MSAFVWFWKSFLIPHSFQTLSKSQTNLHWVKTYYRTQVYLLWFDLWVCMSQHLVGTSLMYWLMKIPTQVNTNWWNSKYVTPPSPPLICLITFGEAIWSNWYIFVEILRASKIVIQHCTHSLNKSSFHLSNSDLKSICALDRICFWHIANRLPIVEQPSSLLRYFFEIFFEILF